MFPIVASLITLFIGISYSKTARNKYKILKSADGKKHIYIIIVAFLLITAGIVHLCLVNIPQISVSPKQIDLGKGERKMIGQLNVRNNTNKHLYQILIKMILKSDSLSITNDDIKITNLPHDLTMNLRFRVDDKQSVKVSDYVFGIDCLDSSGNKTIFLFIDNLGAQKERSFQIANESKHILSLLNHTLICSFVSATSTPTEIWTEQKPPALGFLLPSLSEEITLKGFRVIFSAQVAEHNK